MAKLRLGEIVIRTINYYKMIEFYNNVIGLEKFKTMQAAQFFKISDDLAGHPQILAIFKTEIPSNGPAEPPFKGFDISKTSLHHFAFALEKKDFLAEQKRLENSGFELRTKYYPQMEWRSFYLYDPDGNTVEFVCHDNKEN